MKKIILTLVGVLTMLLSYGQQERQLTQFMYNKLSFNPGYAGSYDAAAITGIYRNQWIGLDGAPKSVTLSFDTPLLNKKIGVGLNLHTNKIGITNTVTADGAYAYRVKLGEGTLGIGVQASIRYFSNDYTDDRLQGTQDISGDNGVPAGELNKYVPNFGAGLYYHTPNFYVGLSVPRFLRNNIDFSTIDGVEGKEFEHIYTMAGVIFGLNAKLQLQPQVLFKYVKGSPFDADFNVNLIYDKRFTFGATYRVGGDVDSAGESIDILASAYITPNVMFGLSYDFTMSDLKSYNSGSVEAVVRYSFGSPEGEEIVNPRFF